MKYQKPLKKLISEKKTKNKKSVRKGKSIHDNIYY